MNHLFIFDNSILTDTISYDQWNYSDNIYLFPLSSQLNILQKIQDALSARNLKFVLLDSSDLISASVEEIRDPYIKLIGQFPNKVKMVNQNLKKWFSIDKTLSMWWLSLILEKNTFKTESFNTLTKFDAIVTVIQNYKIENIIFGSDITRLKKALLHYLSKYSIPINSIKTKSFKGWREHVKDYQQYFCLKHFILLVHFARVFFLRTRKIQKKVRKLNRDTKSDEKLLFITYYPSLDMTSAEEGIFRNKYYANLQETLEEDGRRIRWVAIFVDNNLLSLTRSLEYANEFIKNGNSIFFLEEFNSLWIQVKSFFQIMILGLKFIAIEKKIAKSMCFSEYNFYAIFRDDWFTSFSGSVGYSNLIYYYSWQSMLKQLKTKKCLYYCEMHAWEKALILANQNLGSNVSLLAYQHAAVSHMLLNYFNDPTEMAYEKCYDLPQPDKLICNGEVPYNYMLNSGWAKDKLIIAEAIRYNHLKESQRNLSKKKNIILLAFSINVFENSSLLSIVFEALHGLEEIEVWVKPHPFLLIEKVFNLLGIKRRDFKFEIKEQSIEELLSQARIVVAGESSVVFEALAFGCDLITINTPEQINMSPLKGVKSKLIWNVNSSKELKNVVENIIKRDYTVAQHIKDAQEILNKYFHIRQKSNRPVRLMNVLDDITDNVFS